MKKLLLLFIAISLIMPAQSLLAETEQLIIPIVKNGGVEDIELDDGTIVSVDLSSDDAEQEDMSMDAIYDDDIDAGWEGEPGDQHILSAGLRFQNVTIPNGATIVSAYIEVTSHEAKTAEDVAEIKIVGEATDHALTYDLENLITDRPQTMAYVDWVCAEEWDTWGTYQTPDISTIIQEIVNRPGWSAGNSLAIMMLGKDQGPSDLENAREFEAFENISDPEDGGDGQNHPERVPKLVIEYTPATSVKKIVENSDIISVYPNPVNNGQINVFVNLDGIYDISIVNQLGSTVKSIVSRSDSNLTIDVQDLPAGAYILKLSDGQNIYTQKIIVK